MPSTLVHVAVGGLVGAALLGHRFTPRAIAVVLVAAALPDLDSFLALVWAGAHRTVGHSLVLVGVGAVGLHLAGRRERSWLRGRVGDDGIYVAWVALAAFLAGGVLPDLMTNGVNAFWPLHNQFYTVDGKLVLSNRRGIVQTFVDLSPEAPKETTKNVRYKTGVNPTPWQEKEPKKPPERIFPVVTAGWQLMLVLTSAVVVGVRTIQSREPRNRQAQSPGR